MNRYVISVTLQVEVDAFNATDALEAVEDVFGPGAAVGLSVTDLRVNNVAEF